MISGLTTKPTPALTLILLVMGALGAATGCERSDGASGTSSRPSAKPASLVSFPPEVQADDPDVNAFIRRAIAACVAEDYEGFRLLWSALEEPLGEQEFRLGFAATRKISILDLVKRRTKTDEIVYLVHCVVELDPEKVPEPVRDVVLMLRLENGQWRVATPPSKEVQSLKAKYARDRQDATSNGIDTANASTS